MVNTITVSVKTLFIYLFVFCCSCGFFIHKKTRIHFTENERLSKVTYADSSFAFEREFCLKAEIILKPWCYEEANREAVRQEGGTGTLFIYLLLGSFCFNHSDFCFFESSIIILVFKSQDLGYFSRHEGILEGILSYWNGIARDSNLTQKRFTSCKCSSEGI